MARVLVIGGTLFIGRAQVDRLLARGDEVVLMHRGRGTPFGDRVREIRCDRNDVAALASALRDERFDLVFDNVYDWERGTTAAQVRAAALAQHAGLGRYVFTSSVAVYGPGRDHDEDGPLRPAADPGGYGRHKAESERALFTLHRERGVPVTTLRPAFVYGPHNPFEREAFFWDRIVAGRPVIVPGEGTTRMQWVHVDDVARAALAAGDQEAAVGRAFNLANPPVTQVEFVHALARAAGRDVRVVRVPREVLVAAGGSLLAPPLYFGAYLDLPEITVRAHRVTGLLGVDLTPWEEGLRDTFRWYAGLHRPVPDWSWEDRLIGRGT
jgi:2'-hydroxyisoflavone reductase